jgi:hypothetical protein
MPEYTAEEHAAFQIYETTIMRVDGVAEAIRAGKGEVIHVSDSEETAPARQTYTPRGRRTA